VGQPGNLIPGQRRTVSGVYKVTVEGFQRRNSVQVEVRQLAAAAALPNQARRDSQGICFLGKVRFSEFIREHLGTWHGAFLEEETNEIVGYHEGFWFYTLGQRKGIPLSGGPW